MEVTAYQRLFYQKELLQSRPEEQPFFCFTLSDQIVTQEIRQSTFGVTGSTPLRARSRSGTKAGRRGLDWGWDELMDPDVLNK